MNVSLTALYSSCKVFYIKMFDKTHALSEGGDTLLSSRIIMASTTW